MTRGPVDTTDGFESRLRAAFAAAAEGVFLPPTVATRAANRPSRPRRWVVPTIAAAVAVAVVAVGFTVVPRALRDHPATVVPAASVPASSVPASSLPDPAAAVYGARVGWLPAGLAEVRDSLNVQRFFVPGAGSVGPEMVEQTRTFAPADETARYHAEQGPAPTDGYSVSVLRGMSLPGVGETLVVQPAPTVASLQQWMQSVSPTNSPQRSFEATTVNGTPAVLERVAMAASGQQAAYYSLYWVVDGLPTQPGEQQATEQAAVEVGGRDLATVRRLAARVVVGARPAIPGGPGPALSELNAALTAAFDGTRGVGMLDAVSDSAGLEPALRSALAAPGEAGEALRAEQFGSIRWAMFVGDGEAGVSVHLGSGTGRPRPLYTDLQLVKVGDQWEVTAASYCMALTGLLSCPASATR